MSVFYKRFTVTVILTILWSFSSYVCAQGIFGHRGFIFERDSLNANTTIFDILDNRIPNLSSVNINQSPNIPSNYSNFKVFAANRKINGFRIRLFFDNKQDSRVRSEELVKDFTEKYPETPAYRTHTSPFFKVTVGDFRNMSDAMRFLKTIERSYPSAFIVRENINPPR